MEKKLLKQDATSFITYKENIMAKPLGIVAMLALLITSGTALAEERILMRGVSEIQVTNTNKIFFELRSGDMYSGELQMCPVADHVVEARGRVLGVTPLTSKPWITEGTKVAFTDVNAEKNRKKRLGTCEITNIVAG